MDTADDRAVILPQAATPLGAYPHARRAGDLVFVSGTSSRRPDGSIAGAHRGADGTLTTDIDVQTRAVLDNIRRILQAAGADLSDVVQVTTFLTDMADFDGYNAAYTDYFSAQSGPARTTVAVAALPHPDLAVEIQVIAWAST